MDQSVDYHNLKLVLLLHIKQTAIKCIMLALGNNNLILLVLMCMFMQLNQMQQNYGLLIFNNLQQPYNHFILLTIFLVLVEHVMIYYWF